MATQTIYFDQVDAIKFNNQDVNELYINSQKAWPTPKYLIFSVYAPGQTAQQWQLSTANSSKNWDGTIEYSTDYGNTWNTWDGTTAISSNNNGDIWIRGKNNTYISKGSTNAWQFSGNQLINCYGNIESLLDHEILETNNHPVMADSAFSAMFYENTNLRKAPSLNSPTATNYCYSSMFQNCTNLEEPPDKILASTFETRSCNSMFKGCTSLIDVPSIKNVTTIKDRAFYETFRGCTSLSSANSINISSAEAIGNYCFASTFRGCTSLINLPTISLQSLTNYCFYYTFADCSSLNNVLTINYSTLTNLCFAGMYMNCTSLEKLPSFYALSYPSNCCNAMFNGCTKIKLSTTQAGEYTNEYRIPSSGTSATVGTGWSSSMFQGTGGTFTGNPTVNTIYYTSNTIVS